MARQICMGEMWHGLKDRNSSNSWARANGSSHHHQTHNNRHDVESPGHTKLYRMETWKHMFCHSRRSSCCPIQSRSSDIHETEIEYKVILTVQ